jgi:tetratricopeptide (TPR) repeat protein
LGLDANTQQALMAAMAAGDQDRAGAIAEAALAAGQRHAALYLFAGVSRLRAGNAEAAVAMLAESDRLQPGQPQTLMALGDALRFTGQLFDARRALEAALALIPDYPAAWYSHALTLEGLGLLEPALDSYRRVAALAPGMAPGHAGMAAVFAQLGRPDEARAAAGRALALSADEPTAMIALARCHGAEKRHDEVISCLAPLANRTDVLPTDKIAAMTLLGDALDGVDRQDEAFAAYSAAGAGLAAIHGAGPSQHVALIEAIERAVASVDPAGFSGPATNVAGAADRHVFLLGYPRSGVTLVEQVLATASDVETLEEVATLAGASEHYLHAEGIAALGRLSEPEAQALRNAYWDAVRGFGADPAGKTFVDMDPLKTLHLPLIAKLFPAARVVFVRRDPRDVVWSCFRRSFVISAATREFTSLESTARHYDRVMRLAETCISRLPLNVHMLDYAALVRDFDAETQRLCAFVGLPWSEDMRRFDKTARERAVSTRSASQVRRGLFDGNGQWRRYERHLAPVLPILEPWVRKFGFAD